MNTSIVSISNHKGGVGKTQTALEVSYFLAAKEKKVLIIDADPQANASTCLLDGAPPDTRSIDDILIAGDGIHPKDVSRRTYFPGISVDLVHANIKASRLESKITTIPKEYMMVGAIEPIKANYDYIIIDTAPSAELLGLSSLIASDGVLVPVTPDMLSLDGVDSVLRTVNAIQRNTFLNSSPSVMGIIVTRLRKTNSTAACIELLKKQFGELLIPTPIRECTAVQQAISNHRPVLDYAPTSNAAKDYLQAINEITFSL